MAKKDKDLEFKEKWEPTREDVATLRENMKPFSQRKIHDRLYSSFDQYCASIHIIRIDEYGITVLDPMGRTRLNEVDSYRQSLDRFEIERMFQTYPEEREKYMEKIKSMRPANLIKRI